jgi:hypothetical protein
MSVAGSITACWMPRRVPRSSIRPTAKRATTGDRHHHHHAAAA